MAGAGTVPNLCAACPPGRRPYGYWMVERRLNQRPAGEAGELRLIRQLDLYRDAAKKEFVQKRLAVITAELRSHFGTAAWPPVQAAPTTTGRSYRLVHASCGHPSKEKRRMPLGIAL